MAFRVFIRKRSITGASATKTLSQVQKLGSFCFYNKFVISATINSFSLGGLWATRSARATRALSLIFFLPFLLKKFLPLSYLGFPDN
jgi:hypothetical protein